MVCGIDENFVDNFEESRDIFDLSVDHPLLLRVVRPHNLTHKFDASYVHIRALQDMLKL